ncbi:MAG: hypothetical protein OXM58_07330 [Rhodospirillaceae bacterium]|nr:hypothetical protein [Rhodospirillaceae bacterium]MDE0616714.1 hypothetical protein [Rhodospirillaceae bacterium]
MTAKRKRKPKPKRKKPVIPPPMQLSEPVEVRLRSNRYQPTKAEMEETFKLEGTPEDLARAVLRPVRIVTDPDA